MRGGVILFLHFGNFFLSGAALKAKLDIPYTAIASTANFHVMSKTESVFWRKIHKLADKTYAKKMFRTEKNNYKEMLRFLKDGNFLGSAMDVIELNRKHKFHRFNFLCNQIYLQTGPARLAKLANVPLYGMIIAYNRKSQKHTLYLSGPYSSDDYTNSMQQILNNMEEVVSQNMDQLFHDIFRLFKKQSISNHELKSSTRKKRKNPSFQPLAPIQSDLPENFSPRYESEIRSWHPHRGFAYDLIRELRPRTIVELGVHYGDSYFTFCQACEEMELESQLYGIDHWQGDEQAGFYGDDVFQEVNQYNEEFYSQNSSLHKMHFEEALNLFEDGSIDLLHIDGSHEYEEVKSDFEKWLPKVKKGGRILIHDILVEREDFGVKRLWNEIQKSYHTKSHDRGFGLGLISFE